MCGVAARGLALGLALLIAATARAETAAERAEQLFVQGQEHLRRGHVDEACGLLEESQRSDAALGTLLNLAVCHQRQGRTATAFREYLAAAAWAESRGDEDAERAAFARTQSHALASALSLLRIVVTNAPAGVTVRLDGSLLSANEVAVALPLDPGRHALEVLAPGKRPWRQDDLRITAPGTTIAQVFLEDAPPLPAGPQVRPWPWPTAISGGAVLMAGTAMLIHATRLGAESRSTMRDARTLLNPEPLRSHALALHAAGRAWQRAGYLLGGMGALALGAGLYGLLRRARDETPTARVAWVLVPELEVRSAGMAFSLRLP